MTGQTTDTAPILVTGGTGTLGRPVVARLQDAGRTIRVLSRGKRPRQDAIGVEFVTADLSAGAGVEAAVAGVRVIVHLAGTMKGDGDKARTLMRAAKAAGVEHVVFISVVGADRVPMAGRVDRAAFGYFDSKHDAEEAVAASGVPWTTLRATQLYDLTFATVQAMARLPVVPVPSRIRFQPMDTDEVAARLVELALSDPAGLVPDVAGPRTYDMAELVRSYLHATGKHRALIPVHVPGKAAAAIRAGANLAPERAVGHRTWETFLAQRLERQAAIPASDSGNGG